MASDDEKRIESLFVEEVGTFGLTLVSRPTYEAASAELARRFRQWQLKHSVDKVGEAAYDADRFHSVRESVEWFLASGESAYQSYCTKSEGDLMAHYAAAEKSNMETISIMSKTNSILENNYGVQAKVITKHEKKIARQTIQIQTLETEKLAAYAEAERQGRRAELLEAERIAYAAEAERQGIRVGQLEEEKLAEHAEAERQGRRAELLEEERNAYAAEAGRQGIQVGRLEEEKLTERVRRDELLEEERNAAERQHVTKGAVESSNKRSRNEVSWPEGAPSRFDNEWTDMGISVPIPEIRAGRQLSWRFRMPGKSFTSIDFITSVQKALEYVGKPQPGWLINMENSKTDG